MRFLPLFFILSLGFLSSCAWDGSNLGEAKKADADPENFADNTPVDDCEAPTFKNPKFGVGIIGGQPVGKTTWIGRETVLVQQSMDEHHHAICSGTLVAPNVILTAAHCIDSKVPATQTFIYFSTRPRCGLDLRQDVAGKTAVVEYLFNPSWVPMEERSMSAGGDLVLLKLVKNAPLNYKPVRLIRDSYSWLDQSEILLAGYGQIYSGKNSVKRYSILLRATTVHPSTRSAIEAFRARTPNAEDREFAQKTLEHPEDAEYLWLNQSEGTGLCHGDSGGPAFIMQNGEAVQIGISASVYNSPTRECQVLGFATNILKYKDWLSQNISALSKKN